jgi:hypothetical protein
MPDVATLPKTSSGARLVVKAANVLSVGFYFSSRRDIVCVVGRK